MKEKILELEAECDDSTLSQLHGKLKKIETVKQKLSNTTEKVTKLESKLNLPTGSGPLVRSLEQSLQKHKIQRQKYHGKSFIGNDCHKYLSHQVYSNICDSILEKTTELTENEIIRRQARDIVFKFKRLWGLFASIHKSISYSNHIDDDFIPLIQRSINEYTSFFRENFPGVRITLKQHLLEDHAVQWLAKYHYGFGLFGEQGIESIHHKIRIIADNHIGIVSPLQRLLSTIEEHHLQSMPEIAREISSLTKSSSG